MTSNPKATNGSLVLSVLYLTGTIFGVVSVSEYG